MDGQRKSQKNYIAAGLLAGVGCAAMVVFPQAALDSAQKGVSLWAASVLPALLPFFICANFLIALEVPRLVGQLFEKPFRLVFGVPGIAAFVFTVSITSGYPMGAKLIADLRRRGEIRLKDARGMLAFCSTSGPLFMLGAVGVGMLGSSQAGLVIALAHYGGALLNGILWRPHETGIGEGVPSAPGGRRALRGDGAPVKGSSVLDMLTDAILSALKTLGIICGYIVLFTMIADFLELARISLLIPWEWGRGMLSGILEMTVGCNSLGAAGLSPGVLCALCTFLISFGGLSIFAQSMSLLAGSGVSPLHYLKVKLTHGFLAGALALFFAPRILGDSALAAGAFAGSGPPVSPEFWPQWLFSSELLLIVLIFFGCSLLAGGLRK